MGLFRLVMHALVHDELLPKVCLQGLAIAVTASCCADLLYIQMTYGDHAPHLIGQRKATCQRQL